MTIDVRDLTGLPLRPDNLTPPTRTPWGGRRIVDVYKADLALPSSVAGAPVGESWELSVDPAFPSFCQLPDGDHVRLDQVLAADPAWWLGQEAAAAGARSTPMLVKLLDTADELSVQVHPEDTYSGLAPGESGKPESWYILHAAPGAGIYLGLQPGVTRPQLAAALAAGVDLRAMLHFEPVTHGDAFVIGPGTVHAVGAGVTLVEPQLVKPGRSGKTYRFWDWNRRYDVTGQRDPSGRPRDLHVDHCLAVTRFDGPRGADFVRSIRPARRVLATGPQGATREHLASLGAMSVERLAGRGEVALAERRGLAAVVVTAGAIELTADGAGPLQLRRGTSGVVAAGSRRVVAGLSGDCEAILTQL